jgi:hypothetical protein
MRNGLESMFRTSASPVRFFSGWQALPVCEETDTLVFCCNGVICLLKNYKRFLQEPSKDPEWFAAYRLYMSGRRDGPFTHLLEDEHGWLSRSGLVETSLSVRSGRALWVSTFPVLVDWRNAKSVEDVKVNLLCQDYDSWLQHPKFHPPNEVDPSTIDSASKYERFVWRQLPDFAYKYTLRGTSCAILTQTTAYIVETQARRTKYNSTLGACRGAYGPETEQRVAFRTVRCFD